MKVESSPPKDGSVLRQALQQRRDEAKQCADRDRPLAKQRRDQGDQALTHRLGEPDSGKEILIDRGAERNRIDQPVVMREIESRHLPGLEFLSHSSRIGLRFRQQRDEGLDRDRLVGKPLGGRTAGGQNRGYEL